jgi:uncharacterized protein
MIDMRIVDVFEMAREGRSVEGEVEASELGRLSALLAPPMGRIRFRLQGRIDEQGRPAATLQLQGHLGLICDLCGSRLEWPLDESERFFFVQDEEQLSALPIVADGDEPLLGSRRFDVQDLVEEQTILSLPISPRHPACERPAAQTDPEQIARRPFAALASLKRRGTDVE